MLIININSDVYQDNVQHTNGTSGDFYTHIKQTPDGSSTSYVENDDSSRSALIQFGLTDMPTDFIAMQSLWISIDIQATSEFINDACQVNAQILDNNGVILAKATLIATENDTDRTQRTRQMQIMIPGDKASWDSAVLKIQWVYLRQKGKPDKGNIRVYGCKLEGSYGNT